MCRELKLFRDFMILNMVFLLLALPFQAKGQASPAVIYQGSYGKIIPGDGLRFRDDTTVSTGSIDPTSTAFDAPSGSLYISTGTGLTYQKQDAGETTNWNPLYFVPVFTDDNRLVKTDGTNDVQQSGVTVSDTDQVSGITQLDVDNVRIDGFTVSTTATNQSLSLVPNGTGTVDVEYLSDNGSAVFTGGNGALSADFPAYRYSTLDQLLYVPGLQADNVEVNGNTISTGGVDQDLILDATGEVQVDGFAGDFLLESSATGGITESTQTVADLEGKLDQFAAETNDNRVARTDTDGTALQGSLVEIDDLGAMSGLTDLTVDNLNLNGNTLSSTDTNGSIAVDTNGTGVLDVNSPTNLESVSTNQVAFGQAGTGDLIGDSSFLYEGGATDKLRAGGMDFEDNSITPYATPGLSLIGNGGPVTITNEADINNLNFLGSSILGTDATEDLTISAEATRRVKVEDVIFEDNAIYSETAAPLTIDAATSQPVNIDDVNIQDNAISASVTNDDLELAGDGTGGVRIDRGGTLYEAGSRNPEYVELVNDPSFQAGVAEWSCTDATVTQVTSASPSSLNHGVDRSQTAAKITVTADGGYCEIVKTIGTSQAGTYVPSIYYASSSANAFIEFARDSRARVVDGLDFINSGDYEFLSAQLIASTGLSVRLGGNNTDVIYADMASFELGGYNRSASKDCSGVLDCENEFKIRIDVSGTIIRDDFNIIDGNCTASGTSNETNSCTYNTGIFTVTPHVEATPCSETTGVDRSAAVTNLAATGFSVTTRTLTNTSINAPVCVTVTKQGADYKTTEDQGVTIIPDNKDARLVVTNEGTTTNVTIGNATITVPFDTVKPISKYIDFASNEATFQKSGEYQLVTNLQVENAGSDAFFIFPEVNRGAGFALLQGDNTTCNLNTSSASQLQPVTCPFIFTAEKGDKLRLRVSAGNAGSVLSNDGGVFPRMIITPLGGGEAVVENTKRVEYGVEQWFGEYQNGEKVYQYCNEVATDITADGTIETIATGLIPVESINHTGDFWAIDSFGSSNINRAWIRYRQSSGQIQSVVDGFIIGEKTVFCMKYRKP